MSDTTPWRHHILGWIIVAVYAVATLAAVAIATGRFVDPAFFSANQQMPGAMVPGYVLLYGFLGAMTYAFTSLVKRIDRGLGHIVRVGMRVLAVFPLVVGVTVVVTAFDLTPANTSNVFAGLAFLVGLYVNMTLQVLGEVATRVYGSVVAAAPTPDSGDAGDQSQGDRPSDVRGDPGT